MPSTNTSTGKARKLSHLFYSLHKSPEVLRADIVRNDDLIEEYSLLREEIVKRRIPTWVEVECPDYVSEQWRNSWVETRESLTKNLVQRCTNRTLVDDFDWYCCPRLREALEVARKDNWAAVADNHVKFRGPLIADM